MKKLIIISGFLAALFFSCANGNTTVLNKRIEALEIENQKLKDSIMDIQHLKILKSQIFGSGYSQNFKANQENKLKFDFVYSEKTIPYSVYTTDGNGEMDSLIYDNLTENSFDYKFIPKKKGQYHIKLVAVFETGTKKYGEIKIPIYQTVLVTE